LVHRKVGRRVHVLLAGRHARRGAHEARVHGGLKQGACVLFSANVVRSSVLGCVYVHETRFSPRRGQEASVVGARRPFEQWLDMRRQTIWASIEAENKALVRRVDFRTTRGPRPATPRQTCRGTRPSNSRAESSIRHNVAP
jgi:hypothetical protein